MSQNSTVELPKKAPLTEEQAAAEQKHKEAEEALYITRV